MILTKMVSVYAVGGFAIERQERFGDRTEESLESFEADGAKKRGSGAPVLGVRSEC